MASVYLSMKIVSLCRYWCQKCSPRASKLMIRPWSLECRAGYLRRRWADHVTMKQIKPYSSFYKKMQYLPWSLPWAKNSELKGMIGDGFLFYSVQNTLGFLPVHTKPIRFLRSIYLIWKYPVKLHLFFISKPRFSVLYKEHYQHSWIPEACQSSPLPHTDTRLFFCCRFVPVRRGAQPD